MVSNEEFVEFQQKISALKYLRRTGWCMRHVPKAETVAAHSWRMALMAMQKKSELKPLNVDMATIIEMCILHDVAEAVVGDIIPEHEQKSDKRISKEEKKEMEMRAIDDFAERYHFPKLRKLFNEYEDQQTMEAKIVKDLDKIDMLLQAYEYMTTYPELTGLDDFINYSGNAAKLPIFAADVAELKARQFDHLVTPHTFLDFQTVAGKLKHLEGEIEPDVETVAAHDWQTAVMLLHLEDNLTGQGVDVLKAVEIAVAHNMGKAVLGDAHPSVEAEKTAVYQLAKDFEASFVSDAFNTLQMSDTPEACLVRDLGVPHRGVCLQIPIVRGRE